MNSTKDIKVCVAINITIGDENVILTRQEAELLYANLGRELGKDKLGFGPITGPNIPQPKECIPPNSNPWTPKPMPTPWDRINTPKIDPNIVID